MRILLFSLFMSIFAAVSVCAESVRVRPDGNFTFKASISGPTRIAVVGDRISKIIQADSQFELANDENTGDVFLRFVGSAPERESGHIITERGHTIGFTLVPDIDLPTQTILVNLIGLPQPVAEAEDEDVGESGFAVNSAGSSSFEGSLTECLRTVYSTRIGFKRAGDHRTGLARFSRGGCKARILSVPAADARPQSYHNSRTLGVWVDDIAHGRRRWVIVLER